MRGYTLIELVIVLLIMTVLSAISLTLLKMSVIRAKAESVSMSLSEISRAVAYRAIRNNETPCSSLSCIQGDFGKDVTVNAFNGTNELVRADTKLAVVSASVPLEDMSSVPLSWAQNGSVYTAVPVDYGLAYEARLDRRRFFNE
jgi:prepilin-type N-terminal cleavage/methylation domain-containing protein